MLSTTTLTQLSKDELVSRNHIHLWFEQCWKSIRKHLIQMYGTEVDIGRLTNMFSILSGRTKLRITHGSQLPYAFIIPELRSRPFWDCHQFVAVQILEKNYAVILEELNYQLPYLSDSSVGSDPAASEPSNGSTSFTPYMGDGTICKSISMVSDGNWDLLYFYQNFKRNDNVHRMFPRTSAILESLPGFMRGLVAFSSIIPGTHIIPHTGPSNLRLTCHLGLSGCEGVNLTVERETQSYRDGKCLILDDSYVHSVMHGGKERRITLMLDLFHSDLTEVERLAFLTMANMIKDNEIAKSFKFSLSGH